jgi:hypothetical protein
MQLETHCHVLPNRTFIADCQMQNKILFVIYPEEGLCSGSCQRASLRSNQLLQGCAGTKIQAIEVPSVPGRNDGIQEFGVKFVEA